MSRLRQPPQEGMATSQLCRMDGALSPLPERRRVDGGSRARAKIGFAMSNAAMPMHVAARPYPGVAVRFVDIPVVRLDKETSAHRSLTGDGTMIAQTPDGEIGRADLPSGQ